MNKIQLKKLIKESVYLVENTDKTHIESLYTLFSSNKSHFTKFIKSKKLIVSVRPSGSLFVGGGRSEFAIKVNPTKQEIITWGKPSDMSSVSYVEAMGIIHRKLKNYKVVEVPKSIELFHESTKLRKAYDLMVVKEYKKKSTVKESITPTKDKSTVHVKDGRDPFYAHKIDSTHFYFSVNGKPTKATAYHVNQFRDKPYYTELRSWLKNSKTPEFNVKESTHITEGVTFTDGAYMFSSNNGIATLKYNGKEITYGDFDRGADGYFMNQSTFKGQKFFDDGKDVLLYFKKNKITTR